MIDVERVFGSPEERYFRPACAGLFFTGFHDGIAGSVHTEPSEDGSACERYAT
jgi:hypothetical protein